MDNFADVNCDNYGVRPSDGRPSPLVPAGRKVALVGTDRAVSMPDVRTAVETSAAPIFGEVCNCRRFYKRGNVQNCQSSKVDRNKNSKPLITLITRLGLGAFSGVLESGKDSVLFLDL